MLNPAIKIITQNKKYKKLLEEQYLLLSGVRYILEAILKTFADVEYESIESNLKDL